MKTDSGKIRVGVVGLGFGGEFPAIHAVHPDVEWVAICDTNADRLKHVANRTGITRCYSDYATMLKCGELDAVHILSGIPDHARHSIAALEAGKHCACTVPMATSIQDLRAIIKAVRRSGKNYMMMETAIFKLADTATAMEVTRSLFHLGRGYTEMFNVYGENGVFEWPQHEGKEDPLLFEMTPVVEGSKRQVTAKRLEVPDFASRLPEPIQRFTQRHAVEDQQHQSFLQGGGHSGSHPHLVHEFIRSIVEGRKSAIDEVTAANWTAAGICAHTSAMKQGARVRIPQF